jgi:hypothetical protein
MARTSPLEILGRPESGLSGTCAEADEGGARRRVSEQSSALDLTSSRNVDSTPTSQDLLSKGTVSTEKSQTNRRGKLVLGVGSHFGGV